MISMNDTTRNLDKSACIMGIPPPQFLESLIDVGLPGLFLECPQFLR